MIRVSSVEGRKLLLKEKRRHKRGARPVAAEDGYFRSTLEYEIWCERKLEEKLGLIHGLERETVFPFWLHGIYIGSYRCDNDFVRDGKRVVEDTKGMEDAWFRRQKRMMWAFYRIEILVTKATGKSRVRRKR